MGKKIFKTILKVAAVAAISYFAPVVGAKLAATIGAKGALASTVASAAVGAAAGEATGVGWQQGALAGGFAGAGQSGLFGGGPPASGAASATTTAPAQGAAGVTTAPAQGAAGVTTDMLPPGVTTGVLSGSATGAAAAGGTATLAGGAPQTIGGALSSAASNPLQAVGTGLRNLTGGVGAGINALGSAVGLAPGALGAVAPQLLAAGLAGSPGSALARAQEAELQRAQQFNAAVAQQRLDEAKKLIGEAEYFDPEYMGRQAAEAAMIRGGIQETEGTRGLTGERRAAEQRRYRLGTARTAGTAYQQGFGTGVQARTGTRNAGIQALPSEFPITNVASAVAARDAADRRRAEEQAGLAALFGQALGQPATQSRG